MLSVTARSIWGEQGTITLLSCDNLPHNGNVRNVGENITSYLRIHARTQVLRRLVTQISEEINYDGLTQYVRDDTRVSFPNSMVDRITPATTEETVETFAGYVENKDRCQWPVIAEDFTQWVLEDDFVAGHPSFEQFEDIHFVDNVAPYEDMKLRLLNGSHTAMAYMSRLAGLTNVDEAMKDSDIERFVSSYMDDATCSVPQVPGIDLRSTSVVSSLDSQTRPFPIFWSVFVRTVQRKWSGLFCLYVVFEREAREFQSNHFPRFVSRMSLSNTSITSITHLQHKNHSQTNA